jgi:hypothetical protein
MKCRRWLSIVAALLHLCKTGNQESGVRSQSVSQSNSSLFRSRPKAMRTCRKAAISRPARDQFQEDHANDFDMPLLATVCSVLL